uniref:Uncharacterized protein n=1 Tax=Anguilla anguilla TaxID=7936 RepID=A0A0E9TUU7_ANGAN
MLLLHFFRKIFKKRVLKKATSWKCNYVFLFCFFIPFYSFYRSTIFDSPRQSRSHSR